MPAPRRRESFDVVLTKAAYAVEGVTDVFAPTTIAHVPQIVAALVTGESERLNRVTVSDERAPTVAIDARIGVDSGASAAQQPRVRSPTRCSSSRPPTARSPCRCRCRASRDGAGSHVPAA